MQKTFDVVDNPDVVADGLDVDGLDGVVDGLDGVLDGMDGVVDGLDVVWAVDLPEGCHQVNYVFIHFGSYR